MDRRVVLIAGLAIAVGCAAVVAVGMQARASRRAARLAAIQSDLAEAEHSAGTRKSASAVSAPADGEPLNDAAATTPEPPADASAIPTAAAEPGREYHKHKKKRRPQLDGDSRRLSNSAAPRREQTPANPATAATGEVQAAAARQALSFVGIDPNAEAVWADAINDPSRTPHERQDLIEDLNEDGFPDPKHVTAADLPLIESRLALIEQFAPDAMDDVNAAAFAEAYKDLVNMYGRAVSESEEP
jgi:hypothetical protein